MVNPRADRGEKSVVCIACGDAIARSAAREYDKHGDRWEREDKSFEYLCRDCHSTLCHQPRAELEALLIEIDAGENDSDRFLSWYTGLVEERYGPLEDGRW